jgi:hypothetical protein
LSGASPLKTFPRISAGLDGAETLSEKGQKAWEGMAADKNAALLYKNWRLLILFIMHPHYKRASMFQAVFAIYFTIKLVDPAVRFGNLLHSFRMANNPIIGFFSHFQHMVYTASWYAPDNNRSRPVLWLFHINFVVFTIFRRILKH